MPAASGPSRCRTQGAGDEWWRCCADGVAVCIPKGVCALGRMILQSLLFTKLGPPFETPSGGAWDDQITYNFTTDPEYGDVAYVNHYRDL